ncbi:MAG: DNA mismatch repair endonuclease MutL [Clostridia bacterium]|nr:DNA mismatch repair endonuclease MutL [Clostridia bacterium]
MPQIFQMPPQMANLIAAGEVVERPGSVVKELVENAVDAGASHITVEIKHGGVTYLRVTDDGKGILPEDVRTAFLRHATSKVRTEADLEKIGTLGFRGEALAAISSVARVDLFTRTADNTEGVQITIEGGQETGYGATGCPVGTTVVIRDLFFNVPARAKFLKKDVTEGGYVENIVTQIAVSQPQVAFKLIKDGRESFSTPGDGKMLSAIYATGGKDLAGRMLSILSNQGDIRVSGFVAPPEITRATRAQQNFYINGRWIRSKLLTAALEEAYKGRLMTGRYPVCWLQLDVHPSAVDVNVHPAKLEVKFSREKEIFSAVYHSVVAVLESGDELSRLKNAPQRTVPREDNLTSLQQKLEFKPQPQPLPVERQGTTLTHRETFAPTQKAVAQTKAPVYQTAVEKPQETPVRLVKPELKPLPQPPRPAMPHYSAKPAEKSVEKQEETPAVKLPDLPAKIEEKPAELPVEPTVGPKEKPAEKPAVRVLGEAFHTYLIAEDEDGLWLIDKHAAHEKMLFDKLKSTLGQQASQLLLTPKTVTLSQVEQAACLEHLDLLEQAGFAVEDFGRGALLVREAPMYLAEEDIPFVLSDLAGRIQSHRGAENELLDELLKSVACKAAVKAGMSTDTAELQKFAETVLADDSVRNCPHGRPCVTYVSRYQLEKLFKRIV